MPPSVWQIYLSSFRLQRIISMRL
uniref:Uncharacterized protein n=1 Tax=Anguilla anguilla TaxID=7936 RepID=A0A0E9UVI8_ANGAN